MTLNGKKTFKLENTALDKLIMSKYGGKFNFIAVQLLGTTSDIPVPKEYYDGENNKIYDFDMPNMSILYGDDGEKIRNGIYKPYCAHQIFKCLLDDGFIEEGHYLIKVSW